jgi:DNA-binding NarL/FixJ family response regulator
MPEMDGLEVARYLSKSARFILHTSDFGDRDVTIAAMKLGAMGVVPKITNITAYRRELEGFLEKE